MARFESLPALFDHVHQHLLKQGVRAESGGQCHYHTVTHKGVLKCAAGAALTDEEAKACPPGGLSNAPVEAFFKRAGFSDQEINVLTRLQSSHDVLSRNTAEDQWKQAHAIAHDYCPACNPPTCPPLGRW